MRKPIKTSHQEIVDYWVKYEDESGLTVDWAEAHERCWRCSYKSKLQRCHIVPDSLGGSDEPSNLVLLCHRCHREAPNVADPRFLWIWLRANSVPLYDTYWTLRGYFEFEQMFGRLPFTNIELTESQMQLVEELIPEEMQNAIIHFGESLINPATIACILARIEERLTGKLPQLSQMKLGQTYALKAMGLLKNTPPETSSKV